MRVLKEVLARFKADSEMRKLLLGQHCHKPGPIYYLGVATLWISLLAMVVLLLMLLVGVEDRPAEISLAGLGAHLATSLAGQARPSTRCVRASSPVVEPYSVALTKQEACTDRP